MNTTRNTVRGRDALRDELAEQLVEREAQLADALWREQVAETLVVCFLEVGDFIGRELGRFEHGHVLVDQDRPICVMDVEALKDNLLKRRVLR